MSKKKRASSPKTKQGRPARTAAAGQMVSIDEFRARSSGDEVSAGFMKWIRANTALSERGDPLPVLRSFLENHRTAAKTELATVLEPFATQVALGKYSYDHPAEDFDFALQVVMGYLIYLDETDLWRGSDRLFEDVREALLESVDQQSDAAFDDRIFEVPALSRTQTRDALLALPLAARLQAFIEWFGDQRDVTSTGLLTRKDIEGAAAALDVAAQGVNSISGVTAPGAPLQVTSARQVPQLDLYWDTLVRIELINVGARRATMGRALDSLAGAAHEEFLLRMVTDVALGLYLQFIAMGAAAELEVDEDPSDTDLYGDLVSSVLLYAAFEEGMPTETLEAALATLRETASGDVSLLGLALDLMVEEGLLERDTHIRIPAALKKFVAYGLAIPAGLEVRYEDPEDEELGYLGAED